MNLRNTCVEVCDSRSMHVLVNRYVTKLEHEVFIDCHPLCGGRDHTMVNSYQAFP